MGILGAHAIVAAILFCTACSAQTARVYGKVQDCSGSQIVAIRDLPVYLVDSAQHPDLSKLLARLEEEARSTTPDDYFKTYDELLKWVRTHEDAVRRTLTNDAGEFAFDGVPKDRRYVVLAISTDVEDEATYFRHVETGSLDTDRRIPFWMSAVPQRGCGESPQAGGAR